MVHGINRTLRAVGCANCRLALVRSFTAIAGIPLLSTRHLGPSRATIKYNTRFTSNAAHPTPPELGLKLNQDDGPPLFDKGEQEESIDQEPELIEDSRLPSLPWYLQNDKPLASQRALSERQKIPDLPENSPSILEPLLRQISVDLGLDDLTLLDLRGLDPPPALGANLLMIIGTARSEKHLHVSAGTLCRWLRSEYNLRPDADGLLGRNELKLKMRRKNRRAKLLGSGNADEDFDDGIRTGWVCVNVGTVEQPLDNHAEALKDDNFIGFGRQTEGTKVVVQMLVEEKRNELDLEKLWSGIKRRQLLGKAEGDEDAAEVLTDGLEPESEADNGLPSTSKSIGSTLGSSSHFSQTPSSTRGFHTSARLSSTSLAHVSPDSQDSVTSASAYETFSTLQYESIEKPILSAMRCNDYDALKEQFTSFRGPSAVFRGCLVKCLKQHLDNLTAAEAIEALGSGSADFSSTPLLSCLTLAASGSPSKEEWEFQIWLYSFGRKIGHEGYDLTGLEELFEQLQLCGINISKDMYLSIIRSALVRQTPNQSENLSYKTRMFVADVLRNMHERRHLVLSTDVFITLHESFSDIAGSSDVSLRLNTLMEDLLIQITEEKDIIRLLAIYAKSHNWDAFWNLWRTPPRNGHSRSAALYAAMFQQVAAAGKQTFCINVLRDWIPEMGREDPEVKFEGDVLNGVKSCLTVADPSFQESSLRNDKANGEWLNLWRRCLQGAQKK